MNIKRKALLPLRKHELLIVLPFLIFAIMFVFAESKKQVELFLEDQRLNRETRDWYANHVIVGYVDPSKSGEAASALAQQGITSVIDGSVVYSVTVPKSHRKKAVEILQQDSKERSYHFWPADEINKSK